MTTASRRPVSRHARMGLLASTALLALPMAAHAQDVTSPTGSILEPQIIISQPGTPTTAIDASNVNGVGQMVVDEKNGFIGLCTGTLINPRTVIFAAHCVNENPAGTGFQDPWGYGAAQGGIPISFGFANNNLPALRQWLLAGATQYKTVTSNYLYNVNQVLYNPDSTKLGIGGNFLQGDVAIASLDTPAANVPTWAILLSALPAPAALNDTTGTGYHVIEQGYGTNGVGTTGAVGGIDYRRRAAENYIGLLGSLDDLDLFLFGTPDGLPQNLYQLDFDDPRRGTAAASPYDFNVFKDTATPKEGITGPGDSGGPLILDNTFSKQLVIAVLSGGDRFFNAQVSGSYGTSSFYQPLYLFWDYIAANNPYRYVGAKAGDAKWTDATHWVTNVDPAYQVIVNGQLVNGVPTTAGEGINGTSGKFGAICFDSGGVSDCYDVNTGVETVKPANTATTDGAATTVADIGTGVSNDSAKVAKADLAGGLTSILERQDGSAAAGSIAAVGDATAAALPAATLANGLPGATNFVPNNIDPNATTKTNARYFDVTLSETGTTTLDTAVTVDRLTISGAGARLVVTSAGSLVSNINISQLTGGVQNDGVISTPGDYMMLTGALSGSGRINTPYFTSVAGMIAPGTLGGIGTLTVGGNGVLASGTNLLIDLGANNTSDRLAFVATTFNGNTPTNGIVSLGGKVGFAPVAGHTIRYNDLYTILTAQGGLSGAFSPATALSAILTPTYIYNATSVQVRIAAGQYRNVVAATPIQSAYAGLLDQNRSNYGALSGVYGSLDLQNAATIRSTLEGLAPRTETLKTALGNTAIDNASRFYRDHLAQMDVKSGLGGTLAVIGKPFEIASMAASDLPGAQQTANDSADVTLQQGRLPDDMSGFLAGGYIDGKSRSMPTALPFGGHDKFDGYFLAVGLEKQAGDNGVLGFGFSYTNTDGDTRGQVQHAKGELYQGTLYGKLETASGIVLDTQFSAGAFVSHTDRSVGFVGTAYRLKSVDSALTVVSEVGLGKAFDLSTLKVGPRISIRASHIGFEKTLETGGGPALAIDRDSFDSLQGRAGLNLSGGTNIRPYASANFVHDFQSTPGVFGANFVGGIGPNALFALAGQDKNWGEISAGLTLAGDRVDLSVGADTTVERKDVSNQSYKASVKVHF